MKGKTHLKMSATLAMLLLTIAACAVFLPHESVFADIEPQMYISPSPTVIKGAKDSTFTLMLMIQNFTHMYAWQADIEWNPAVLSMTGVDIGDSELPNNVFAVTSPGVPNVALPGSINNTLGKMSLAAQSLQGNVSGETGTVGVGYYLMSLDFIFVGVGTTAVNITDANIITFVANTTSYGPVGFTPVSVVDGSVTTEFGPVMYITPSIVTGTSVKPGYTFSVLLMLQNFTNVYTWQANLKWNPSVLNVTGIQVGSGTATYNLPTNIFQVLEPSAASSVLPSPPIYPSDVNFAAGTLKTYVAQSLSGIVPGVNGTGTLATGSNLMNFTFKVVGIGTSPIGIVPSESYYLNTTGAKIVPQFINGSVVTYVPAPYGPTASFTATPMIQERGLPVVFDASASMPGFNGSAIKPITVYSWNFGDGNITNTTGPTITHTYINTTITSETQITSTTNFNVTLTVYAPGAKPESNSASLIVRIYPPAIGASLDLTSNADASLPAALRINGTGPGAWSDSFAPQELMILYAKVTYNTAPVAEKLVSFYVEYPNGTIWIQGRVNETGTNGIAEVEFRIPNSPKFGDYIAYATVEVAGAIAADYMPFYVGWLVVVTSVSAASSYALGADMVFNATVTNYALTPQNVTLTFVAYDAVGVPIGCYTLNVTLPAASIPVFPAIPSETEMYSSISMIVPSSAFVGSPPPLPAVFVDSFTAPPWHGGVPTGPEASATFAITK